MEGAAGDRERRRWDPGSDRGRRGGDPLADPTDVDTFSEQLGRLLNDAELRATLGKNARQRVRDEFLGVHQLIRHGRLIECVDQAYEECGRPEVFTHSLMERSSVVIFRSRDVVRHGRAWA